MTTLMTHAVIPIAIALAAPQGLISSRLLGAGVLASLLPDADMMGFYWGIPYSSELGHRGFTHSLLFAVAIACCAAAACNSLRSRAYIAFLFVGMSCISHPLLDMLTSGGKGVALFWPFEKTRVLSSFRPVSAAPMNVARFFTDHGWQVFKSELFWIWLPFFSLALIVRFARR